MAKKLKYSLVAQFLDANGYDEGSFCVFLGISRERLKEIRMGAEPTDAEIMEFCDCVGIHPGVLVDET